MMSPSSWSIAAVLLVVPIVATACGGTEAQEDAGAPAVAEHVKGSDATRVVLSADAAKRLGVRTLKVRRDRAGPGRTVIPYAAVLYDPDGATWTYTSPKPLVFQRKDISIARIDGDKVILSRGPPVGTPVVTVGSTEIWGVEYGGIEED
jgi:hypothetical protein